ncbi:hypothetical protein AB0L05_00600 [Nonomuraea pusilla]|uniref:hypothetical protein n=1 Tax=Nonomuraea pusilla TaxID=46177 RepID=UPI0033325EED
MKTPSTSTELRTTDQNSVLPSRAVKVRTPTKTASGWMKVLRVKLVTTVCASG